MVASCTSDAHNETEHTGTCLMKHTNGQRSMNTALTMPNFHSRSVHKYFPVKISQAIAQPPKTLVCGIAILGCLL